MLIITISFTLLSGLGLAILIMRVLHNLDLREHGKMEGPIIVFSESEGDTEEFLRCNEYKEVLEKSGNQIFKHLSKKAVKFEGEQLQFIKAIIYKDGHPAESWGGYLERRDRDAEEYIEKYHRWLRSIGKPEANLEWYERNVLRKAGAKNAKYFTHYKK